VRAPQRVAIVAALALGSALAACGEPLGGVGAPPPAPDVIGNAPEFALLDQVGAPFGSAELRDRLWVANFIFTRCTHTCPRLSARMAKLQRALRDDPLWNELHLVSFSVDPEHDRPQVLAGYAARYGADADHWSFLTGERETIWELSKGGFKLAVGEAPGNVEEPLFHSGRFVLVDGRGRIRGYYDALDEEGFDSLLTDLRALAAEEGGASG
jgi:protein SCO1/2